MEYQILEMMLENEKPESVFEIGCSNGGLLKDIRDKYGKIKVGGMDVLQSVNDCKGLFPDCKDNFLMRSITEPWPIADKSYDIVFSVGVLMYVFDPIFALKEMLRVAKDKIILAEYHHSEVDFMGMVTKGYYENDKIQIGLIRNYITLFQVVGVPVSLSFKDSKQGKTIIKVVKREEKTPANGK